MEIHLHSSVACKQCHGCHSENPFEFLSLIHLHYHLVTPRHPHPSTLRLRLFFISLFMNSDLFQQLLTLKQMLLWKKAGSKQRGAREKTRLKMAWLHIQCAETCWNSHFFASRSALFFGIERDVGATQVFCFQLLDVIWCGYEVPLAPFMLYIILM